MGVPGPISSRGRAPGLRGLDLSRGSDFRPGPLGFGGSVQLAGVFRQHVQLVSAGFLEMPHGHIRGSTVESRGSASARCVIMSQLTIEKGCHELESSLVCFAVSVLRDWCVRLQAKPNRSISEGYT